MYHLLGLKHCSKGDTRKVRERKRDSLNLKIGWWYRERERKRERERES